MQRSWLLVIGFCIVLVAGLSIFKYKQIQAAIAFGASFPEPSATVEVTQAIAINWRNLTTTNANIVAEQSVAIQAEIAGLIQTVGFKPGAYIKQGQLLIALDARAEKAELKGAKAALVLAQSQLTRTQSLLEKRLSSAEALDIATANFQTAQAQVESLTTVIAKKTIYAPFDAASGLHTLEAGQYIEAGTILTRLIGISDTVWLDFYLPQHEASLQLGDTIKVYSPNIGTTPLAATIIAADAWVDANSRSRRYRASMPLHAQGLVPGAVVSVEVELGETRKAVSIPSTATRYSEVGTGVYVLHPAEQGADAPERVKLRKVIVDIQRNGATIISQGLTAGERVAANGSFKLRDGMLVHAVNIAPTATPDSARE